MRVKCDDTDGDLNLAHMVPRVSGYKKGNDITKGGITEGSVYLHNETSCIALTNQL
jgi:hypothetical protein